MEYIFLSDSVNVKQISEKDNIGVFTIGGLYRGYGLTIGNALRRTLLSSLPGAAVTQIKIKGIEHEFSTVPGMIEDVVELCLNIKRIRFRLLSGESQTVQLKVKGEREIKACDIKTTAFVEVINPDLHLATLSKKNAEIDMELIIEKGLGYVPLEQRKRERLSIGAILLDAVFSPVRRVDFDIENMRIGERTDYNRINIEIETDGSISPKEAFHKAASILKDHFEKIYNSSALVSESVIKNVVQEEKDEGTKENKEKKIVKKETKSRKKKEKNK